MLRDVQKYIIEDFTAIYFILGMFVSVILLTPTVCKGDGFWANKQRESIT